MSDIKWFSSYDEMAVALGISKDSARRLATRRKWPRQPGNDGRSRIGVPIERIPVAPPATPTDAGEDAGAVAPPIDEPGNGEGIAPVIKVLTDHVERLTRELEAVKAERDGERARAAELALQAAQVTALNTVLDEVRQDRDRWYATATARRGWWPWRRSA